MSLVNMKQAPREKAGSTLCAVDYEEPAYPYGLSISLDEDSMAKLGITEMPKPGSKMRLVAIVEVTSVSQHQAKDGDECRNLGLQITDMALAKEAPGDNMAARLYGG